MENPHKYIDIFAGCGGLSAGLLNAGWSGLFAVEKNADAFNTFKYNLVDQKNDFEWVDWLPISELDINELITNYATQLRSLQGKIQLVAGGPPCQGFSMAGKRDRDDQRNKLVDSYVNFIKLVMPEAIIFENVHGFTVNFKDENGTKQYSSYVENELKKLGYATKHQIIDMSEYGLPQKRKRFILVAMLHHSPDLVFSNLENNKARFCASKGINCRTTVYEAIEDLEMSHGHVQSPDSIGFKAGLYGEIQSGYQQLMRAGISNEKNPVDNHRFVKHREKTIALHNELLNKAPTGKRINQKNKCVDNLNRRGVTVLDRNTQAPTITSIPDELVHYREPRVLTVREHARLQGFPDWYQFKGKYTSGGSRRKKEVPRYTQVGNAVPPLFAEQIGIALMKVLNDG